MLPRSAENEYPLPLLGCSLLKDPERSGAIV
jgi:hypothetical protein